MKKQTRKLMLNRETLAQLQTDDLANVNGGAVPTATSTVTTTTITRTVSPLCIPPPTLTRITR